MSDRRIYTEASPEGHPQAPHPATGGATHPHDRKPGRFQLLYNQAKGLYRLHAVSEDQDARAPGFTVLEEYGSRAELKQTLRHWPHLFCFVVYEEGPREVAVTALKELPATWLDDDRLGAFTLFNDEAEARRYAEERRARITRRRTAA